MPSLSVQPKRNGTNEKRLNDQERTFVHAYLASDKFNATEAAKKAGYAHPSSAAGKLMSRPRITNYLGKKLRERNEANDLTADRIVKELARIGFADVRELFNENGTLISVDSLPENVARAVSSVKIKQVTTPEGDTEVYCEYKFHPKIPALELLGKHMGMLSDKIQVEHGVSQDVLGALLRAVEQNDKVIDGKFIEKKTTVIENGEPAAT